MSPKMRDLIISTFLSIFLGLAVSGILMLFLGADPLAVYGRLLQFLVRDKYTFADIFVKATPLVFTALAFAFTFKANLYNIGAQGQFYLGSVAAVFISLLMGGTVPGPFALLLALAAAMVSGGLWGMIVGYVKARFRANGFLVSMMSVYIALALMNYLLRTVLIETKREYPPTDPILNDLYIPIIINGTRLHAGFLLAVAAAVLCWIFLYRACA
ncbi:ABC transporter, permease protein 1 (cluster 11, riboflavin/purine nucleoside/unknown) [Olavius algarvensis Delta 1 endosymbiont]|nr:ABC transporter, permease protein 1 (cluster 11, riboflavin/purine nucleoside/unknown) [Olavius algarvensis Delta 1 endosymbiont]